jgi:hypothetical protein
MIGIVFRLYWVAVFAVFAVATWAPKTIIG